MKKPTKVLVPPFKNDVYFPNVQYFLNYCIGCGDTTLQVLGVWAMCRKISDRLARRIVIRWSIFGILILTYIYRAFYLYGAVQFAYVLEGYEVLSYWLFLYYIQSMYYFLCPIDETKYQLPTRDDEIQIYEPILPEYECWKKITSATCLALFLTFFRMFQLPVLWQDAVAYVVLMFVWACADRIKAMIKLGYVPYTRKPQKPTVITKANPLTHIRKYKQCFGKKILK